ncbi:MAG: MAPEG family protein [Acetobacteraceae bacterium]|nr:MAPEG family protein [Acetobacteraceae bacterium]
MSFALWAILAAAVLPYLCAAAAKYGGPGYDNARPRPSLAGLSGWRQRADWAQRNHFEAFPPFAAGVLTAEFVHAPQGLVDGLAAGFILVRLVYTAAYIADRPTLRSLLFGVGFAFVIGLFCGGLR